MKFVPQAQFHTAARAGQARNLGVLRPSAKVLRSTVPANDVWPWRFSDYGIDRMNDRINPSGWQTKNFMAAGGSVLFAHDSYSPPIGRTVALRQDAIALEGDIKFAAAEIYDFAGTVLRLIEHGFLRGGSVGFLPIRWKWTDDPARPGGVDFLEQELLEFSITPTPALPSALLQARAAGVDTRALGLWAERKLDTGGILTVPDAQLIELRAAAKEPPRARSSAASTETIADRVARAETRAERLNRYVPPPLPMPEQVAEANRKRYLAGYAAAQVALAWW
jgi:HK97 family phage prohead protease